ncbi:TrmH family RNA methyltransferase [Reichenbachiella versicolor]|uniref:TrmH family RNA methyltransferase n=1 Tax=Reichenbachiella versicolor TaxID=1821036 RepID=UPI000D6DDCC0|nr:RNA methyltransferase [Reichenbachiella versicolor]
MISKRESKFIKSLQLKKFRTLEKKFVVEGEKSVCELLVSGLDIDRVFVTDKFANLHSELLNPIDDKVGLASQSEIEKVGTFKSNNAALAVVKMPEVAPIKNINKSILAFDRVMDPGNLGTIIRIADWYGFQDIVCSIDSVDCYNAKVISSTMGSFTRVKVHYQDLKTLLRTTTNTYGAALGGEDLHKVKFSEPSIILFGNESHGIADDLLDLVQNKVKIEGFGQAESLNVAVSTAIFCDNFKRLTV